MPPELQYLTIWEKFGLPGLVIGALLLIILALYRYVIQPMMALHREERREWLDTCKTIFDRHDQRQTQTNACLSDLAASQQAMSATLSAINTRLGESEPRERHPRRVGDSR